MNTINTRLYNKEDLQKCMDKTAVEHYFEQVGITGAAQKYKALLEATDSSQLNFFHKDMSIEQEYEILLDLFLDEEFRFLKGISLHG